MEHGGTWELEVSTPFGKYPATLVLAPEPGGGFGGRIDSRLGPAKLSDITATSDGLAGTVALDIKGHTYTAQVTAAIEDGRIDGQISARDRAIIAPAKHPARKASMTRPRPARRHSHASRRRTRADGLRHLPGECHLHRRERSFAIL